MMTVKAARVAGVVARHRRVVMLRRAAVRMSGRAGSSEYAAWAKKADSLRSWDGDGATMHEWYRIDYDDRGFTMDARPPHNKEGRGTADVAWEDVTRVCFQVGQPPLLPHDFYVYVKGRKASWQIPSEALLNGEPPGKKIMESRNRGLVTPDEQFMIKLVEKGLFTVELFREAILQGPKRTLSGLLEEAKDGLPESVVCYPNFGEPGHDGSPG